jgi:hypothetical protein
MKSALESSAGDLDPERRFFASLTEQIKDAATEVV